MTQLALFDLDHTLLPFDSGMAWTGFLVRRGVLQPGAEGEYLAQCQAYVDGTLDLPALHRATVAPLGAYPLAEVEAWAGEFGEEIAQRIPAAARALVARHLEGGALCALVTATTRFIATPIARQFGLAHVLATDSAVVDGRLSGKIVGDPCYREHKPAHVHAWLHGLGTRLADFERSWFYSDSASDLPLLRAVTHPVVVRPDARLRAEAAAHGWPVLTLA